MPGAFGHARDDDPYSAFARIDGRHPFRDAVPGGHVDYRARRRRGGEVVFFNYGLAREMGLIHAGHPDTMSSALRRALLDAFALVIVNEYDVAHAVRIPPRDLLPHPYMATRYLQLQHPDRRGTDLGGRPQRVERNVAPRGRQLGHLELRHRRHVPLPGDRGIQALLQDGQPHRVVRLRDRVGRGRPGGRGDERGSQQERRSDRARARCDRAPRRLRGQRARGAQSAAPSHLFAPLKQNDLKRLKSAVDYAIARERKNGALPPTRTAAEGYRLFAEAAARAFGRAAAIFEREYVFCWLDWDGDNVLLDGSIVDYGSVRQFGLYHREYRFDDGPRWSTTIPEQKAKARTIVRCFAQIAAALIEGRRAPLAAFAKDPLLRVFDASFAETRDRLLLRRAGFDPKAETLLLSRARPLVRRFDRAHRWFETARSARGPVKVPDGITWNAVYSTRDLLRELSRIYARQALPVASEVVLDIAASSYATRADRRSTPAKRRHAREFQAAYLALVRRAARLSGRAMPAVLTDIAARSSTINAYARITGDAIAHAAARLNRARKTLGPDGLFEVIDRFARRQAQTADAGAEAPRRPNAKRVFDDLFALTIQTRDGL